MNKSISGLWLFSIVIVFMMVLIAYVAISINYSNAYKLKTVLVTKLEQYDGWNNTSKKEIDELMHASGYRQTGNCVVPEDNAKFIGVLDGHVTTNPTTKQNYCVSRVKRAGQNGGEDKYYYNLTIFLGFNLPVLGDIYTFRVSGETGAIYYPKDNTF